MGRIWPRLRRILLIFIVPLAITIVGAGVVYPGWRARIMAENERAAGLYIRILYQAEMDYRANDRDRNGVDDYWTWDVSELSRFGILPREVGLADARPRTPLAPKPVPFRGYYFEALETDDSVSP